MNKLNTYHRIWRWVAWSICLGVWPCLAMEPGVEVGLEVVHHRYCEPRWMSEEGLLLGAYASGTVGVKERVMLKGSVSYVMGDLRYKADSSTGLNVSGDTPNTVLVLRGEGGYPVVLQKATLTPYVGLGWRELTDDLPDLGGLMGYKREQTYLYFPVGCEVAWRLGNEWFAGFRAEYDIFLEGQNTTAGQKLTQDQGWGWGAAASLERRNITSKLSLGIEIYAQYWDIEKSDRSTSLWYEPANSTTSVGIRFVAQR